MVTIVFTSVSTILFILSACIIVFMTLQVKIMKLKRAFITATIMLLSKRKSFEPTGIKEADRLFIEIQKTLSSLPTEIEPHTIVDSERFNLLINKLKNGEWPTEQDYYYSPEQIEAVKSVYAELNRELDDHFYYYYKFRLLSGASSKQNTQDRTGSA